MKKFSGLFAFILLILSSALAPVPPKSRLAFSRPLDPQTLLDEAKHLSWLDNWVAARPLYVQAELLFRTKKDRRNETYARIGRIRGSVDSGSWTDASRHLERYLGSAMVRSDPQLRLWCAAAKGDIDLGLNIVSAKTMWKEVLHTAGMLHQQQWVTRAVGELAIISFLEGDLIHAVDQMGQSLSALATTPDDVAGEARMLTMTGDGFSMMLRYGEAQWFLGRAISMMTNTPAAGYPYDAHVGWAHSLAGQGRVQEANNELNKVFTRAQFEKNLSQQVNALVNLGEIALKSGDLQGAKDCFERAKDISRQTHERRLQAVAMIDLASVYRMTGDLRSARSALRVGLAARQQIGDKYYLPRDWTAAAEFELAAGHPQIADRLFTRAERAIASLISNEHSDLGKSGIAGAMSETYLQHFHLLEYEGRVGHALELMEQVRGRTSEIGVTAYGNGLKPSAARQVLEAHIAALQVSLLKTDDPQGREELQDQLLQEERRLAVEDNRQTKPERSPPVVSLAALQKTLNADELFLEYVLLDADAYCIAVTTEGSRIIRLPAGGKKIEELSNSFLRELKEKKSDETNAAALYNILIQPAQNAFPKPRLIIAPDGNLNLLPFEALRSPNGNFLIQSKVISYAGSATALWTLRRRGPSRGSKPLLAVGDVDYLGRHIASTGTRGAWTASAILRELTGMSGANLQNLPYSRAEVLAIANMTGAGSKVLLGQDATESALKSLTLSDYRILHLAVHAIADSKYPERSALVLGEDQAPQDGLLQVREIERLRLHADLVTLSACETRVGASEGEAGVLSLERAFLVGGARSVIASLWTVEDHSTTELMEVFYRYLASGDDEASALAEAKREFIDKHQLPYFWAVFVISGEASKRVRIGQN